MTLTRDHFDHQVISTGPTCIVAPKWGWYICDGGPNAVVMLTLDHGPTIRAVQCYSERRRDWLFLATFGVN